MEKMVFKNQYLNVIFGSILVIFAIVGYFTNLIEDYLPIIIGIVLVLFSTKRFLYTFKKIISKNATLILVVEFILDLVFAGLLIYLGDHVELFLGLIIYTRGVSYLIINYVATRKVQIVQYLVNILYVTFGSFLIFTSYNSVLFLAIFISVLMLLIGAVYLQAGIRKFVSDEEKEELKVKQQKEELKLKQQVEKQKLKLEEAKSDKKITELENKVKAVEKEHKEAVVVKKDLEKKVEKLEPKKEPNIDYSTLTLVQLKALAKQRNITGISQLNKAEIVAKLKK